VGAVHLRELLLIAAVFVLSVLAAPPLEAVRGRSAWLEAWLALANTADAKKNLPWLVDSFFGSVHLQEPEAVASGPEVLEVLAGSDQGPGRCELYRWTSRRLLAGCWTHGPPNEFGMIVALFDSTTKALLDHEVYFGKSDMPALKFVHLRQLQEWDVEVDFDQTCVGHEHLYAHFLIERAGELHRFLLLERRFFEFFDDAPERLTTRTLEPGAKSGELEVTTSGPGESLTRRVLRWNAGKAAFE
jgi:hypothetical protein